jgi:hypothetical protein
LASKVTGSGSGTKRLRDEGEKVLIEKKREELPLTLSESERANERLFNKLKFNAGNKDKGRPQSEGEIYIRHI